MRALPLVCALAASTLTAAAQAETIYGVTDTTVQSLFRFDSAAPAAASTVATIIGMGTDEVIRGIDFRPANGRLYAVTTTSSLIDARLYTIDLASGAATPVGSGFTLTDNTSPRLSIDFDPVADRLRVITGDGLNFRVNAYAGSIEARAANVLDGAGTPLLAGLAYSDSVPGASQTTLYAYDFLTDRLGRIGSVGGTPDGADGGVFTPVGPSGIVAFSAAAGLDISGVTGLAYLAADDAASATGASEFFTVDLGSGAVSFVGTLPEGVIGIAALPAAVAEPAIAGLVFLGLAAGGGFSRSRRRR